MDTVQPTDSELGEVIDTYKHPGIKVSLSALGVGAVLWLLLIGFVNLWDDRPMGMTMAILLLALTISITAILLLPIGLFSMNKKIVVYQKGLSCPSKKGNDTVYWDNVVGLRRQASGPIFPGLLGDLFAAIGGSIIQYTIKQVGQEDVVFTNQMVQKVDVLAEQIATVAKLTRRSTNQWTRD